MQSKKELVQRKATTGEWFVEMSDLTIRCKNFDNSDCMADYRGSIIADLKPSLGISSKDVENGVLSHSNTFSYLNGNGGRQHAWREVIDNAMTICNVVNAARVVGGDLKPKDKIVFRANIWHHDDHVNYLQSKIGRPSKISELVQQANDQDEFKEHIALCDEVESVIKHIALTGLTFSKGLVVSIRNGKRSFKIDRIEYYHLGNKQAILCEVFFHPNN